ncbi:hypothetical protein [Limnovirga soli]|uniref:hypothetical protein n=1 Tax=Limnovirga soli TaxID=2656915 RepID=UPI0014917F98|nr:hypothetical protein [Limnovirga soli]
MKFQFMLSVLPSRIRIWSYQKVTGICKYDYTITYTGTNYYFQNRNAVKLKI